MDVSFESWIVRSDPSYSHSTSDCITLYRVSSSGNSISYNFRVGLINGNEYQPLTHCQDLAENPNMIRMLMDVHSMLSLLNTPPTDIGFRYTILDDDQFWEFQVRIPVAFGVV
jgi:hypothetical protein